MTLVSSLNTGLEGASNYLVKTEIFKKKSFKYVIIVVSWRKRKSGLIVVFDVLVLTLNRMISVSQHLDFP